MHKNQENRPSTIISSLEKYGKYFESTHSTELIQMYGECLDKQMNNASSRPMYANVAQNLKNMMKFTGGKEKAYEIKEDWFVRYRNRSAMKDELNKILKEE